MTIGEMMRQDAVREFARKIIAVCAPEQLELFDPDAAAYFADPARALAGDPVRDKALAGGFAQEVPSLVPMALYLAEHVLTVSTDHAIEKAGDQLRDGWRKLRRSRQAPSVDAHRLAAFEVRFGAAGDDRKVDVVAVIADQEFRITAAQAARMIEVLAATATATATAPAPAVAAPEQAAKSPDQPQPGSG